MPEDSS